MAKSSRSTSTIDRSLPSCRGAIGADGSSRFDPLFEARAHGLSRDATRPRFLTDMLSEHSNTYPDGYVCTSPGGSRA
jgi:hypothetical protein